MLMKYIKQLLLLLTSFLTLVPTFTLAWFSEGHEVIAQIAYDHLNSKAKDQVDSLLGRSINWPIDARATQYLPKSSQLSKYLNDYLLASSWPDVINLYTWKNSDMVQIYAAMHFININGILAIKGKGKPGELICHNRKYWEAQAVSKVRATHRDNILSGVRAAIKTLTSKGDNSPASFTQRAVALRFLIHWSGDITMPFHVFDPIVQYKGTSMETQGANLIRIDKPFNLRTYPGTDPVTITEWHAFWDSAVNYYLQIDDPTNSPYAKNAEQEWHKYGTEYYRPYIEKQARRLEQDFSGGSFTSTIKDHPDYLYWVGVTAMTGCQLLSADYYGKKLAFFAAKNSAPRYSNKYNIKVGFIDGSHKDYENAPYVKSIVMRQLYLGGIHLANILNAIFSSNQSSSPSEPTYRKYVQRIKSGKKIEPLEILAKHIYAEQHTVISER